MLHAPSPPPAHIRRVMLALACAGGLLISAVQLYRAHHAESTGPRASSTPVADHRLTAETLAAPAFAERPEEARPESEARAGVDASNFYKDAFVLYVALTEEEKQMFRQPLAEAD